MGKNLITSLDPIKTDKLDLKFYKTGPKRINAELVERARTFVTDLINESRYFDPGCGVGFAIFYEDQVNLVVWDSDRLNKRAALYDLRKERSFDPNYPAINKFNTTETGAFRDFELPILMHEEMAFARHSNPKDKKKYLQDVF
ncbi:hypothetical protein ISS08_01120 [Candidatus Pacearchaeota archaeon]|nr:hypothetical protein [Candidatus Pacearchaeota archaeon]